MKGKRKGSEKLGRRDSHRLFLDRIIEKYTATPSRDPDIVDYSLRPTKEQLAREQIDHLSSTVPGA